MAAGRDPKGLIRDPELNHRVHLPLVPFAASATGPRPFVFLAGQPKEVFDEYAQAWHACAAAAPQELTADG